MQYMFCQFLLTITYMLSVLLAFRLILSAKNTKKYSKKGKNPFLRGKNTRRFLFEMNKTIPL